MRIRTILASCAFASLFLAPCATSAKPIDHKNFSPAASSPESPYAYAMGLWLQGAAPNPEVARSTAWSPSGPGSVNVVMAYNMLRAPASLEPPVSGSFFETSGPLPGAGVVGLIALLAIAARRDLIG
jgi:hypothetical protein